MNLGLLGPSSYRKGPTGAIEAIGAKGAIETIEAIETIGAIEPIGAIEAIEAIGAIEAKGAIEKSNLFICHSHHGLDRLAGMLPEYMIVVAVGTARMKCDICEDSFCRQR